MRKQKTLLCYGIARDDEARPPTPSVEKDSESGSSSGARADRGVCGDTSGDTSEPVSPIPVSHSSTSSSSTSVSEAASCALESDVVCSAYCCDPHRDTPNQPTATSLLAATKRVQGVGKSKQARMVQKEWFVRYPWLSLCETKQKLFCFYCQNAERRKLVTFSTKGEDAFTKTGFCNWKKAGERLNKHEGSQVHAESCMKLKNVVNVSDMIVESNRVEQAKRRKMLLKQLSSLRFLLRQGLAVRGHEEGEGNLLQLLVLQSEDDPDLSSWLRDRKYLSPDILNEQIRLMADSVLRGLLSEMRLAPWFSILADEATDVKFNEQMCIAIRWVDETYEVQEGPLGLIQVPSTDAGTLTAAMKDVLIRCMLPLGQCRGQAYDGASNMSGRLNGVAARIKSEQPSALHVHCLAHSLNLCLQDAARTCTYVRDALELTREIVILIKCSAKRSHLFEIMKSQLSPDTMDLRPLCPTRWTVRTGAIGAILSNYSTLCTVLNDVHLSGRDEYAMKAGGYLTLLEKFGTFFGLKLSFFVFSVTEQLSITLQGQNTTLYEAKHASSLSESYLRKQRSDSAYDVFYDNILKESQNLTAEPVLPRQRKLPKRLDNGADSYEFQSPKDYFRQKYFEVLDIVTNEINRRFDQRDFCVASDLEKMIIDAANGNVNTIPETVRSMYEKDLDMSRLFTHLNMLPDIVKQYNHSSAVSLRKITTVQTVCSLMNEVPGAKSLCSELHRALQILLTIPVTTATSERTFSVMRRLKTYLRSSMTQERLNHVLILHCYKSRTDAINLEQVAHSFITSNERRILFFGTV